MLFVAAQVASWCVRLVGQCGNQIGYRFWDLALREHASVNKVGHYCHFFCSWTCKICI